MHILITGFAGFIGRNLSEYLLSKGVDVLGIDDFYNSVINNVEGVQGINAKIEKKETWEYIEDNIREIDGIVHLAAISSVPACVDSKCYEVNVIGTKRVVDFAKKQGVKVVFASSAAVYGNYNYEVNEHTPCKPISLYGKYKLEGEKIVSSLDNYTIFRFFNIYGPYQRSGVIPIFFSRSLKGRDIEIYGNGKQVRDFVFVDDIVHAIYLAITSKYEEKEVYNLSTRKPMNLLALAEKIRRITNTNSKIILSQEREGDIKYSLGDNSKIISNYDLAFTPLDYGLEKFYEYLIKVEK